MNNCFLTAQIATNPKKYLSDKGKEYIKLVLRIPNPKKGKSFHYIDCRTKKTFGMPLIFWYKKGDYLILEGNLKLNKLIFTKQYKIQAEINILKDFPISL
jgi:hypothetical protein